MLKYVDFWYALETTKHAQTIWNAFPWTPLRHVQFCCVTKKKKKKYAARQFRWFALQLFVVICCQIHFLLSETIILIHDSVQHKKVWFGLTCINNKKPYIGNSDIVTYYSSKLLTVSFKMLYSTLFNSFIVLLLFVSPFHLKKKNIIRMRKVFPRYLSREKWRHLARLRSRRWLNMSCRTV